ncbi:uncharacterized protein LOC117227479 [Megalopta genalis]|uniref:uncharacterized protein LOC117227479 n=1 Tax=Megalopta genalis TaxID=115081 RepID=UPI0014431028|nr:uncharacterized protein LOC117227479 [Megalopta genalis]
MSFTDSEHFEVSYFTIIWTTIASVGWYIVAILIALWYASPYIREKYIEWKLKKDEQDYAAKYHKNTDLLQQRLSAVEASRQKLHQEYIEKCALAQKDKEEREKSKREASKSIDLRGLGQKLGSEADNRSAENKPASFKKEYNPLMGDSSRRYRPPKRSCCGKGGCE